MLNVDKVYESTWMLKDSVKDYVMSVVSNLPSGVTPLTTNQLNAIRSSLDTAPTANYEPTTPFADFQTNNGVVIPDTPTCLEISTDIYKQALGENIDTTSETHIGRMIEQSAIILKSAIGFSAANVMQMDINSATGRYLDALGSLFFSTRKHAVASKVDVTFTNATSAQIDLMVGSCSFKDANGVTFNLGANATLPANGSVSCAFVCEKTGAVDIDTSTVSWTKPDDATVSSYSNKVYGYDEESDDDYRKRLKQTRVSSVGFLPSVKSAILSITGVYDTLVLENTANTTQTISGVPMEAHSIIAYVDYDGTDNTKNLIANAIFESKAVGCGYTNNLSAIYGTLVTATVTESYFGQSYTVYFYKPSMVALNVNIEVTKHEYTGTDLAADVKTAIVNWANGQVPYVDGIKIGTNVKAYEIGAAVSDSIPQIQIDNVTVAKGSGTAGTLVAINAYELATIAEGDITVTINT